SGVTPATISAPGGLTACSPSTVILNANTGIGLTYQWYNGTTPLIGATSNVYTASTTGAYSVVVSSPGGCLTPGTSSVSNVTISASPTASITPAGPTTICQGASVVLNANTGIGLNYQWLLNSTNISGATNASYTASQSGNYSVIVTNANNCSSSSTNLLVSVNPIPVANITPSGTVSICQGNNIVLNASTGSGYTYQWSLNSVPILGATSSSFSASQAGNYIVDITSAINCSASSSVTSVLVNPLPIATANAAGPTVFCQGDSVVLNANSGTGLSYQWYLNGTSIVGATGINYTASQSGNYTVQVANSLNCINNSNIIVVSVNALPIAQVNPSGAASFCVGGSIILNATTGVGYSYQWYQNGILISGATNSSYNANLVGNYTVEISNANNCVALSSATTVSIAPNPPATITPNGPTVFCQGGNVLLSANSGIGYTYQWYLNGVAISGATSINYTAFQAGNFTVQVTNASNCFEISLPVTIIVNSLPSPVIINTGGLLSVSGGSFITYQWFLNGVAISGATNATYTVTQNGNYYVEVTQDGCIGKSAVINLTGVGINDINHSNEIVISPNPTQNSIHIDGVLPYKISIRNLQGQILKIEYQVADISLKEFANGIYFIQLFNEKGNLLLNQKITKQ
ncbi:MAG TPA: PKD domain-containing protein, partial [Chitinophagaceae bacterium]|nr:PKD domain-containing protein [Chitinophagaceae bacterium]